MHKVKTQAADLPAETATAQPGKKLGRYSFTE